MDKIVFYKFQNALAPGDETPYWGFALDPTLGLPSSVSRPYLQPPSENFPNPALWWKATISIFVKIAISSQSATD